MLASGVAVAEEGLLKLEYLKSAQQLNPCQQIYSLSFLVPMILSSRSQAQSVLHHLVYLLNKVLLHKLLIIHLLILGNTGDVFGAFDGSAHLTSISFDADHIASSFM